MKVIHILHSLKYSGAEIMYVDAAPFFQEKGCEVTVMATAIEIGDYVGNFQKVGYSILHMPIPPLKNYFSRIIYYKNILALINSEKYNVIHIHGFGTLWGFALCAWISKIRSVYTVHNILATHFYSYPYHLFLRFTAKYLFNCSFHSISDSVYNHEKKLYFNKTLKIYNWYNDERYFTATDKEKYKIRNELQIDNDTLVLISVGGCSGVKRHSDILKALTLVLEKIPNTVYLHLGKGDMECEEKILAKTLGISDKVIFCNNQEDVRKYLIVSDIYLMPSKFEGISLTTIESMACGIPTILYDVPGLRDFNANGENCILIPECVQKLAEMVIYLNLNPEKSFEISKVAKKFVERNFNLKKNANEIFQLYNCFIK